MYLALVADLGALVQHVRQTLQLFVDFVFFGISLFVFLFTPLFLKLD